MVFDEVRNRPYAQAIRERAHAESVVLDLGAGLGLHGLIAAAAGAKRVYLVESEPVLRLAMEVARANGLADRVVALEGRIEDVTLPEQVDLLVSVLTGNLLFSEDLLPSLFHARDRYLKAGGHMIPDFADLMLAPVNAPALHRKHVGAWSGQIHQLDYSAVRRFAANEIQWLRSKDLDVRRLAPGQPLQSVDLTSATNADCVGAGEFQVEASGTCHGLLGWIQIRLGSAVLSTYGTDAQQQDVHWAKAFLPFDEPLEVVEGELATMNISRPRGGDWIWGLQAIGGIRRHSSFLARADGADRLRRVAPHNKIILSNGGRAVQRVLAWMDGSRSNKDIAELLLQAEPEAFATLEDSLRTVQGLAHTHGRHSAR